MPYREKEPEKIYYTIGEVSKIFNVNASLIRFWENEFDIIKPHKNKKGNRLFTKTDIDNSFFGTYMRCCNRVSELFKRGHMETIYCFFDEGKSVYV